MSDTVEITIPKCAFTVRNASREKPLFEKHLKEGMGLEEATQLAQTESEERWMFANSVQWVVDRAPGFNATGPGIRAGARIIDAVAGIEEGGKSKPLSKSDAKALLDALNNPGESGYMPQLTTVDGKPVNVPARVFLPYLDAVENALKAAE